MARLSKARSVALSLVSLRRRRDARMRDLARQDAGLALLSPADRALAFRLAMGVAGAWPQLDAHINQCLLKPSALEPRVRDALQVAAYELCYLNTPSAVAVSQGVELARSVAPRVAGLANAVLRRLDDELRPQVARARQHLAAGQASVADLSLASCVPEWLVRTVSEQRGSAFAYSLCLAQLHTAPVFVAANGLRHDAASAERLLKEHHLDPAAVEGLVGAFALGDVAPLATSGLIDAVDVVVADVSAQLVCRIAAPAEPCDLLEVGQGRGTKSILLATACEAVHPSHIDAVDSVDYKVRLSRRRMERAGLGQVVACHELDACRLADDDLPKALSRQFSSVFVDAPCTGTGTLRRHPEIAATLTAADVASLSELQLSLLCAASQRVLEGGTLTYATCSVLREEDEDIVEAFLQSEAGRAFRREPVVEAPACKANPALAAVIERAQSSEGALLCVPEVGGGDGHFCVRLVRQAG